MLENDRTEICSPDLQLAPPFGMIKTLRLIAANLWVRLIQLGFSLLYNQFAWSYDAVSFLVSLGAWRDWQRAALPFIQGPRVLELAHGPGHMLIALHQEGLQVTGIDLSNRMGRLARRRIIAAKAKLSILQSPAQTLPFAQGTFDTVLATFPTEFILDPITLSAVHRVLGQDGLFVIVPEARMTGDGFIERTIEWLYHVTGQRNLSNDSIKTTQPLQPTRWQRIDSVFKESGFFIDHKTVTLKNSEVKVLIGRKFI